MEIVSKLFNAPRCRIDQTFDQLKLYPLAQYNGQIVRVFIIYEKLQKKFFNENCVQLYRYI